MKDSKLNDRTVDAEDILAALNRICDVLRELCANSERCADALELINKDGVETYECVRE